MENGEWRMENGEWRMENGEWRMENGKKKHGIYYFPFHYSIFHPQAYNTRDLNNTYRLLMGGGE
jgi:hypothetical protein